MKISDQLRQAADNPVILAKERAESISKNPSYSEHVRKESQRYGTLVKGNAPPSALAQMTKSINKLINEEMRESRQHILECEKDAKVFDEATRYHQSVSKVRFEE